MRRDQYRIGSFAFEIEHTGDIPFPVSFLRFGRDGEEAVGLSYELLLADRLPPVCGERIAHRPDLDVFADAGREHRVFRFLGVPMAYGCYEEIDEKHCRCVLLKDFLRFSQVDTVFCSLFALERQMLARGGCVLHCAALCVDGTMVLFSGPSGVGKSTHASLWTKLVSGAWVLNGDRALIQKQDGSWLVYGWPVCGSSEICVNETYPLRAVVFLHQAAENGGARCRGAAAVKALVSQMTVNHWNAEAVTRIWELAEELAGDVPVYTYGCNMEPAAVTKLQMLLNQEGRSC